MEEQLFLKESIYSKEELERIDLTSVPRHVAIIMDGNRRWAKKCGLPYMAGHWKGADTLKKIVRAASELGIKVLTVYSFSTENWNRLPQEVEVLMEVIEAKLKLQCESMIEDGVRLDTIGNISRFPDRVKRAIEETKAATAHCNKIELILALNYGGRDDIRRAVVTITEKCLKGELSIADLSEQLIARYLDTAKWGDPSLLIRTSGELRISNFLLWQISYAEVYVTDVLWPDFNERNLLEALLDYQNRQRRFGG
jgi:undecaprenyl diphosphate synthase